MRSTQSSSTGRVIRNTSTRVNSGVMSNLVGKSQQGLHTLADLDVLKRMELQRKVRSVRIQSRASSTTTGNKDISSEVVGQEFKLRNVLVPGSVHEGFEVMSAKFHGEYELMLYVLRHVESNAEYIHMERNDDDNAFCVSFRTMPDSDNGVAHVLEHTTLCGSQKYPVKDPFFSLSGRSLNTFMNAITRPEATYYPFSTQNEQDFKNLLDVYLDAVFFPKLNELDFKQEGIRLALKTGNVEEEEQVDSEMEEQSAHTPFIVKVGNHEIDMNEGIDAGDDPNLVNVIISEMGFDRLKMTEEQLDLVSKELQQRLMEDDADEIYSDPEASDADDKDVDMSLSSKDMGVHTGALPEAAHRAIDAAEKRDVEMTPEMKQEMTRLYKNQETTKEETKEDAPIDYATVPLMFKGVVYNEMKGVMSKPDSYFVREIDKYFYTNSVYRYNSGGDPSAITGLTYAQLTDFHKVHYHPANACFFTYGNFAPRFTEIGEVQKRKMQDVHDVVPFEKQNVAKVLGNSDRFTEPRAVVVPGPVAASADAGAPTKFQFSWLGKPECITDVGSLSLIGNNIKPEELETAYNFRGIFAESKDTSTIRHEKDSNWGEDDVVVHGEDVAPNVEEYLANEIVNSIENTGSINELIRVDNESRRAEDSQAVIVPEEQEPNPAAPVSTAVMDELEHFRALPEAEQRAINRSVEDQNLSILGYLLVENPSSPLYNVLNDPALGSGRSPGTGVDTNYFENILSFGLTGVRKGQLDAAAGKVMDALYTAAKTGQGLQHEYTLSVLHLIELGLKDVHKGFGVDMISRLISETSQCKQLHPGFDALKYIHRLRITSEKYGSTYMRMLLKHHIISNPHRLLFAMQDCKDFSAKLAKAEQQKLEDARAELSADDVRALEATNERLRLHQENKGDSSVLPSLSVSDIKRECVQFSFPTRKIGQLAWFPSKNAPFYSLFNMKEITDSTKFVPNIHNARPFTFNVQPTNGVVVVRGVIDDVLSRLTPYQLSLLPFLSLQFGKIGTTKNAYSAHSQLLTRHSGGVSLSFGTERVNSENGVTNRLICEVVGKSLTGNFTEMVQLQLDSLCCPNFTDNVHNTLASYAGSLSTALQDDALEFALYDANARLPGLPYSSIKQYLRGLPHLTSAMTQLTRITEETALIQESGDSLTSLKNKPLPAGVTVPPTLMRLANDINETMRCLLLGPAHTQGTLTIKGQSDGDYIPPPLTSSPYTPTVPVFLPETVSCATHKTAPTFAPKSFTRLIVTGDKASLNSPEVLQGCTQLVLASNAYHGAAYHPSTSTLSTYVYQNNHSDYTICDELKPKKALFDAEATLPLVNSLLQPKELTEAQITEHINLAKKHEVVATSLHSVRNNYTQAVSALLCEAPFETAETWLLREHAQTNKRPFNYIAVPSQVNYVVASFQTVDSKHPQFAALSLLTSIIETEFLHGAVREKGGAYGAYCSQGASGIVQLMTYRDPNTLQSVEAFKQAIEWGRTPANLTQQFLDQAKMSMFASIDAPTTPSNRGIVQYLRLATNEERQQFRDRLQDCTVDDLNAAAKKFLSFDNAQVSIVGNADAIPTQIEQDSGIVDGKWNITLMSQQQ